MYQQRLTMRGNIILVFLLCSFKFSQTVGDSCPKPKVQKRTIIQSELSIQNGAELLKKLTVKSARTCYSACCFKERCNVAIMHYKEEVTEEGERTGLMTKHCFLFDCGSPSVCKFEYHDRYAIIEVPKLRNIKALPSTITTSTTSTMAVKTSKVKDVKTTTTEEIPSTNVNEKCPPGAPVAMCDANPCDRKTCKSDKSAVCKPSFCGRCYAKFYDANGEVVNCNQEETHLITNNDEEIAEVQYGETPTDSLPGPAQPTIPATGDPYFNSERRTWPDGMKPGIIGGDKRTTTKATPASDTPVVRKVIIENKFSVPVPLLVALIISILLIIGLIYRFKCAKKGKPKKLPVDDGDYLINGMYL